MAKFLTPRVFALPALLLGSISLSACYGQGYDLSNRYADSNCEVVMTQNCAGNGAGYGTYAGQTAVKTRYGTSSYVAGYEQQAYAQPHMMLRPTPMMPPVSYQQPSYQTQSYTSALTTPSYNVELFEPATSSYSGGVADCPSGTTAQADGTCLQGSSLSYSNASVSTPAYSGGYITGGTAQSCPSGTTASSDGSCLMGGSSISSYTAQSYPTSSASSIAPPISTYDFSDYNWGSKDTTWGSEDYVSPGTRTVDNPNSYPETPTPSYGYMPVRK